MNNRAARFAVAFGIAFLAVPVLAQTEGTVANSTPAPVAYVYVQTNPGVVVYAAAANGTLTPVKGSPFKTTGQMEDISGKILISVGNTILHVYPIESNGAVGKQISETNTASYSGSECGTTSGQGSVLDHTGKYLYVQLSSNGDCAAWQTYQVDSNGHLQFLGDAEYSTQDEYGHLIQSTAPTISSSNKFGYGAFREPYYSGNFCDGVYCPTFSAFTNAGGVLKHNPSFSEKAPEAESGLSFIPWAYTSPRADPYGHIAVLMDQVDEFGNFNGRRCSWPVSPSTPFPEPFRLAIHIPICPLFKWQTLARGIFPPTGPSPWQCPRLEIFLPLLASQDCSCSTSTVQLRPRRLAASSTTMLIPISYKWRGIRRITFTRSILAQDN